MRITESRLRRIIRSVIAESVMASGDFNKRYGDLMLKTGSDYYEINADYVRRVDHYKMIRKACEQGYTMYGNIDEFKAAKIFRKIGCECEYFGGEWFTNNAGNIIRCLEEASIPQRKAFFGEMDALLNH